MSPRRRFASAKRPLSTELGVVTAGLVVLFVWSRLAGLASAPLAAAVGSLPSAG